MTSDFEPGEIAGQRLATAVQLALIDNDRPRAAQLISDASVKLLTAAFSTLAQRWLDVADMLLPRDKMRGALDLQAHREAAADDGSERRRSS